MNTKTSTASAASNTARRPIRALAVDDSPLFLEVIRRFLSLHPPVELVGVAGSGEEALRLAEALQPDLILTDLNMPAADGLTVSALVRQRLPATRVIVVTLEEAARDRCQAAGAHGFVDKTRILSDLIPEIRRVFTREMDQEGGVAAA